MVWFDKWECIRLYAMVWDLNAIVWDSNDMLCDGVCCKKICLSWLYHSLHYLTPSHSPLSLDPLTQHILSSFPLPPTHLIFSSLSLVTFSHHSLPHLVTPPTPSHPLISITPSASYYSPHYLNSFHSTLSLAPFSTPSPAHSSNNLAHFTHQIIAPFSSFFCSTIYLTHLTHPSLQTLTRLLTHNILSRLSRLIP